MTVIDVGIVVLYFAGVTAFGVWFGKRQHSTSDYFLAGRSIPGWVVGFSLIGTMIGSTTFVGHPGGVFEADMWYLPYLATVPFVMLFVSRVVVRPCTATGFG